MWGFGNRSYQNVIDDLQLRLDSALSELAKAYEKDNERLLVAKEAELQIRDKTQQLVIAQKVNVEFSREIERLKACNDATFSDYTASEKRNEGAESDSKKLRERVVALERELSLSWQKVAHWKSRAEKTESENLNLKDALLAKQEQANFWQNRAEELKDERDEMRERADSEGSSFQQCTVRADKAEDEVKALQARIDELTVAAAADLSFTQRLVQDNERVREFGKTLFDQASLLYDKLGELLGKNGDGK